MQFGSKFGETNTDTDNESQEKKVEEEKTIPTKGDRVECNIDGKKVTGVIFNSEISGGQMVGIL